MKKLLLFSLIIFQTVSSYSQVNTSRISTELRYPIPVGNNFLSKGVVSNGYLGLIDIGIDYNIIETHGLGIGVLLNSSILRFPETDITLSVLSPKIKIDYEIKVNNFSIVPQIGVGYSNWRFRAPAILTPDGSGNIAQEGKYKQNTNGLTTTGETKLIINNNGNPIWYFQFSYEFTRLEKPQNSSNDIKYNRNLHLLYPGIGLIWNFHKKHEE